MRSSHIVYVDESGSPDGASTDPDYPVFVLAFCLFDVDKYVLDIEPSFQKLKFENFGHDLIILHESDIRRSYGAFRDLYDLPFRQKFLEHLSSVISSAEFNILPIVKLKQGERPVVDLYLDAAVEGVNRCISWMRENGFVGDEIVFAFESRGAKGDKKLADSLNDFFVDQMEPRARIKFVPKAFASTGLEIADLVARPIGLAAIRPGQTNRSYEIIRDKLIS